MPMSGQSQTLAQGLGISEIDAHLSDRHTRPEGRKPIGVPTEISPVELAGECRCLVSNRDIPTVLAYLSLDAG